jgi:prenyltransferase beta subunit
MPHPHQLAGKQLMDGSWNYPGKPFNPSANSNYNLLETYRSLRFLVEKYGFDARHPVIIKAAEFIFSCQTNTGDIRGILVSQYMPYYHAAFLELLIKAGHLDDEQVIKGLEWLLSMIRTMEVG